LEELEERSENADFRLLIAEFARPIGRATDQSAFSNQQY
jgi:hypothetical protein